MVLAISKLLLAIFRSPIRAQSRKCHSIFGINKLIKQEKNKKSKDRMDGASFFMGSATIYVSDTDNAWSNFPQKGPENYTVESVTTESLKLAAEIIKCHYLPEHVLVKDRNMSLRGDRALDEYLVGLLKQGNSLCAKDEEGSIAAVSVNYASSPVDSRNLRHYAFYRQDPNTKDFLNFMAKLQETPNLWEYFRQTKIFEIKMLAVLPEHRRQGLAVMLVERAKQLAQDLGHYVVRMNCINPYDYKIAERCMMRCIAKCPLHRLRGANTPFIKKSSEHNKVLRVYVDDMRQEKSIMATAKMAELESLIE